MLPAGARDEDGVAGVRYDEKVVLRLGEITLFPSIAR